MTYRQSLRLSIGMPNRYLDNTPRKATFQLCSWLSHFAELTWAFYTLDRKQTHWLVKPDHLTKGQSYRNTITGLFLSLYQIADLGYVLT
jgi:hypothetical protein